MNLSVSMGDREDAKDSGLTKRRQMRQKGAAEYDVAQMVGSVCNGGAAILCSPDT